MIVSTSNQTCRIVQVRTLLPSMPRVTLHPAGKLRAGGAFGVAGCVFFEGPLQEFTKIPRVSVYEGISTMFFYWCISCSAVLPGIQSEPTHFVEYEGGGDLAGHSKAERKARGGV